MSDPSTLSSDSESPFPDFPQILKSSEDFEASVRTTSYRRPMILEVWADWCLPCRKLAPVLADAVAAERGRVGLVTLNLDDGPEIAAALGVAALPAVLAFRNGDVVASFHGILSRQQVTKWLGELK